MVLNSCAPKPTQNEPILPTFIHPTSTPDRTPTTTPSPTPTSTPLAEITNPRTGAIYKKVPNPEGKTGKCVTLGRYFDGQKETVIGAATVLGPDAYQYNDYPRFKVFMPDHKVIGTFTTDALPPTETFGLVPPETIVCED